MKDFRVVQVRKLVGRSQLAGALMGEADSLLFKRAADENCDKSVLIFSWTGISVATGSYIQTAFFPLLATSKCLVICTDLAKPVEEDLEIVLEKQKIAMLLGRRKGSKKQLELGVLGPLDDAYRETLALISEKSDVSAGELSFERKDIGKTAWMNRLSRLYDMRLLLKQKEGKEFRYFYPKLEGF